MIINRVTADHLKDLIKVTAQIREDSWLPGTLGISGGKYLLTLGEAAVLACEESGIDTKIAKLIELALIGAWNDVLGWAK